VFVREQTTLARLLEHGLEEGFGNVPIQQSLAVLGEHRNIPNGIVHVQAQQTNGTAGYSRAVPSTAVRCAPSTALAVEARATTSPAQSTAAGFRVQLVESWLQFS